MVIYPQFNDVPFKFHTPIASTSVPKTPRTARDSWYPAARWERSRPSRSTRSTALVRARRPMVRFGTVLGALEAIARVLRIRARSWARVQEREERQVVVVRALSRVGVCVSVKQGVLVESRWWKRHLNGDRMMGERADLISRRCLVSRLRTAE